MMDDDDDDDKKKSFRSYYYALFLSLLIGLITHYISRLISSSHRLQAHHHDRAKEQPGCIYEELGICW